MATDLASGSKTVAIVGVGLIGSSIGLALRERKLAGEVIGIGRRVASLNKAKKLGAITSSTTRLAEGVADADFVVVCTPVDLVAERVLQVAEACKASAIITDAGSTKAAIVSAVESALPRDKTFVGSHPLAGSEKNGPEHGRADLFQGRVVVVTPTRRSRNRAHEVADFWSGLGATVLMMPPGAHDEALAATSHLPHLVSAAVASQTPRADLLLTATGWRDLTRIAAGDPELWTQILLENRGHVLKSLGRFEKTVARFRAALEKGDRRQLHRLLMEGKQVRDAVGN